jgi:uncharacterized membrane-anchored protein YitT (DUF2179 family)
LSLAERLLGAPTDPRRHGLAEDVFAIITGTLLVAFGFHLIRVAGLATGGTAGLAFVCHYVTGWPLGPIFFVVNLPFYAFAWSALGPAFTAKTFMAVTLLSIETAILPKLVTVGPLDPVFAAVMGGLLIGVGLLALARHKSSLGGLGVMALWLQERHGWRAGKVQMAADCVIVALGLIFMPPSRVAVSVVGAVVLNLVLALNHKPGRYAGF